MSRSIDELEVLWRAAMEQEDAGAVEALVREILVEHPHTVLSSEIRYHRGVSALTEGEGYGHQRLARAQSEFEEGAKAGDKVGTEAEPWRSLNHTQLGSCMARLGNQMEAAKEFKAVADVRPRSVLGLGALSLLANMLRENSPRDARRYDSARISYARALVREHKEAPDLPYYQFLLAQELLDSEYASEGLKLLKSLGTMTADQLGEELFAILQEQLKSIP